MKIRELITKIGFDIDGKKLDQFDRNLNNTKKNLDRFSKKSTELGKRLSIAVTLPALALGAAAVKITSDANEIQSKFSVVFSNIREQSDQTATQLAKDFGLSIVKSQELLSNTADLLTGFGFTQKSALDLSKQVNELAVDLASFTNFVGGAEGASGALTKALLGERESVKSLGIAILEEDVKKQVAINRSKGLTFETERQAKAYATLIIAQRQSLNAIGDYSRTQEQFANQTRLLRARLQDLAISFGKILLPVAAKLLEITINIVEAITNLDKSTKKTILVVIALVSAFGAALLTFGLFGQAILFAAKGVSVITAGITSLAIATKGAVTSAVLLKGAYVAGFAAILLGIEDVISYFRGKDSVFGIILSSIDSFIMGSFQKIDQFLVGIVNKIKSIPSMIASSLPSFQDILDFSFQQISGLGSIPNAPQARMATQGVNINIQSPITVNGTDNPEETGSVIVNKISEDLKSAVYQATINNRLITEY